MSMGSSTHARDRSHGKASSSRASSAAEWGRFDNWDDYGDGEALHDHHKSTLHALSCTSTPACHIIIRSRHASTPWEKVVRTVVGDPVHLDVVLVKEGSAGARFCFSSYMNQKFEMVMMDDGLVHDKHISNMSLEITEEEHERCTRFMMSLVEKASYDYVDAMLIMPMAPKVVCTHANVRASCMPMAPKVVCTCANVLVPCVHCACATLHALTAFMHLPGSCRRIKRHCEEQVILLVPIQHSGGGRRRLPSRKDQQGLLFTVSGAHA